MTSQIETLSSASLENIKITENITIESSTVSEECSSGYIKTVLNISSN